MNRKDLAADLDDFDDGFDDGGGGALGVMAARDNAIEELAALAELHDEVNGAVVFEGVLERDDVGVFGQMAHDLHLPADILNINGGSQFLLGYRFARPLLLRLPVAAEIRDAELPSAQLPAQIIAQPNVPARGVLEHHQLLSRPLLPLLLLPHLPDPPRSDATVPHISNAEALGNNDESIGRICE